MKEFSADCRLCPRLAHHLERVRAEHPDYYARPVGPFGARNAGLLIVGLAPGMHGANRTGRPFTGDHSGSFLFDNLHRCGFANPPTGKGAGECTQLIDCRITNAVKCLPPANLPRPREIRDCNGYLVAEIGELPDGAAVLALGAVAHRAVLMAVGLPRGRHRFAHAAQHQLPRGMTLYDSYHCSRYNTQTRRLTPEMFRSVLTRVRGHLVRLHPRPRCAR